MNASWPRACRTFNRRRLRERAGSARVRKLSFSDAKELEALPARIDALERERADIGRRLADPALYKDKPQEVQRLNQRYAAIERELAALQARWEELEAAQRRRLTPQRARFE